MEQFSKGFRVLLMEAERYLYFFIFMYCNVSTVNVKKDNDIIFQNVCYYFKAFKKETPYWL